MPNDPDLCDQWGRPFTPDYIVVGGGGTGGVLAGRLSEDGTSNVLLLEGGAPSQTAVGGTDYVAASYKIDSQGNAIFNTPLTRYDVPVFAPTTQHGPGSPTPAYPLMSNYGNLSIHSRILGGNSVHNNMQWIRINKPAINAWNLTGWSYSDVLPYFIKSENVSGSTVKGDNIYHGRSGPIEINNAQAPDPIGDIFNKACKNAGYGYTNDSNGPNYEGCSPTFFNINSKGIRASPVYAYVAPALVRRNFKLLTNALVVKVLFNTTYKPPRAYAVSYEHNGKIYTVTARREIILSAGAFNTPKLLMLSGVGPANKLRSLGIPVVADLPVGQRMCIHPFFLTEFNYTSSAYNPYDISSAATEYALYGTGIFASVGFPADGLIKTSPDLNNTNMWIIVSATAPPGKVQVVGLNLGQIQNNGTISLVSADYRVPPYFNYTIFENREDLRAFVNAFKAVRKIVRTAPANSAFGAETIPGPQIDTDAKLTQYVLNGGGIPIITHLYGGAVMGNYGDKNAVLDPRARVLGVTGLRVADLSIVPGTLNGAPIANVVMFGEKISDMIKQDNRV